MKHLIRTIVLTIIISLVPSFSFSASIHQLTKNNIEQRIYNLVSYSNPKLSEKEKNNIKTNIIKYGKTYNLDPLLIASIAHIESNFKKNLTQRGSNCRGLLQVNGNAHRDKLKKRGITQNDLYSVNHNLDVGCEIFKELMIKHNGNRKKALLGYVGSYSAHWYPKKIMKIYNKFS